jgi:5'-nucleotidase
MQPSFELVVCIASSALFDCRESHEIWTHEGFESYKKHQHEHINVPLKPGVGFPLVQSLLELNKVVDKPLVDVVLVSRNDTESAERIIQSINYYDLSITRMSFTSSTDVTKYLPAWKCDLFLSTEEEQVRKVLESATPGIFEGIAARLVYNVIPEPVPVQPNSM